jgi:predicted nucleic acid-binding protein
MKVFLDSSAFTKRYVAENGSSEVTALCQKADSLVVSVICFPEFISTLSRLLREKKLVQAQYRKLKEEAVIDLIDMDICQITQDILCLAISLLESNILRAMDALHVACALAVESEVFISGDQRQLSAARETGLQVVSVS